MAKDEPGQPANMNC